ncbi:MAG: hypothetical protein EBT75_02065 [Proteobacteria bacterium]|nr:hypothetical protein [Pseudomonadota bacterium]
MKTRFFCILGLGVSIALARDPMEPDPMGGALPATTNQPTPATAESAPPVDPMAGSPGSAQNADVPPKPDPLAGASNQPAQPQPVKNTKATPPKPPLTPEIANLNLPSDVEVPNEDPDKVLFLPAGTYRQILQIPIDSPNMQSVNQTRIQRGPEIRVEPMVQKSALPNTKPLWIRYESLEKVKIGPDERRGGIDLPVHGPADLKPRLWYAKSETADTWSSLFYFIFGGAGYTTANLAGWSAGNVREIPVEFQYRLIRK